MRSTKPLAVTTTFTTKGAVSGAAVYDIYEAIPRMMLLNN
jgi:hypothetical protein